MSAAEVVQHCLDWQSALVTQASSLPPVKLDAQVVLDVLKSFHYAVVELPKPDGPLGFVGELPTGLAWRRVSDPDAHAGGVATVAVHNGGDISAAISCLRTPEDARWAAAALLAAADAAEGVR